MNNDVEILEKEMLEDITGILKNVEKERSNLIPVLQKVQERHSYLSRDAIDLMANHLNLTSCEVYGVATFYNQFRFNPPGKHQIKVCLGTACHVKAADIILENFERKLEIKSGETTEDREYSLEKVACIGCCALAPAVEINDKVHGSMAPSKVEGIMLGFQIEKEMKERETEKNKADDAENIEKG